MPVDSLSAPTTPSASAVIFSPWSMASAQLKMEIWVLQGLVPPIHGRLKE